MKNIPANVFSQPHYCRMSAPQMIGAFDVLAFVADGCSSGYALIDMQDAAKETKGNPARFCVTMVGRDGETQELSRWAGHYFETFGAAIEHFAAMAKNVSDDELRSSNAREARA